MFVSCFVMYYLVLFLVFFHLVCVCVLFCNVLLSVFLVFYHLVCVCVLFCNVLLSVISSFLSSRLCLCLVL